MYTAASPLDKIHTGVHIAVKYVVVAVEERTPTLRAIHCENALYLQLFTLLEFSSSFSCGRSTDFYWKFSRWFYFYKQTQCMYSVASTAAFASLLTTHSLSAFSESRVKLATSEPARMLVVLMMMMISTAAIE